MSSMRIGALVLIVAGVLMLGYPAVSSFTTREKVLDVGPVQVTREKEHAVPLVPIAGGVAIVIGIGMLVFGGRRSA